jgi:hypothetical protein
MRNVQESCNKHLYCSCCHQAYKTIPICRITVMQDSYLLPGSMG